MDTFEYKGKTFKMIPATHYCVGCYGFESDNDYDAAADFCENTVRQAGGCDGRIAVVDDTVVVPEQIQTTPTKEPKEKKNDYLVVRRIRMPNDEDSWEEFESTVRGFLNGGYQTVGGISLTYTDGYVNVAQAIIKNKQEK